MRLQVFVVQDDLNKTKQSLFKKNLLNPENWQVTRYRGAEISPRWLWPRNQQGFLLSENLWLWNCGRVSDHHRYIPLPAEQKSSYSSNVHSWETSERESSNFQPLRRPWCDPAAFLNLLSFKHAYLWFLDGDQLSHCFGLHVHLLESMFRVKELTVYFVWSEETL